MPLSYLHEYLARDLAVISGMKIGKKDSKITTYGGEYVLLANGSIVDRIIQRLIRRALKKYRPEEIYIMNVERPRGHVTIGFKVKASCTEQASISSV
jgi:hypothetical protein